MELRAGTRPRTEPAFASVDLSRDREERIPTTLAFPLHSSGYSTTPKHRHFAGLDDPLPDTVDVAPIAGWDEVLRSVVSGVLIDVVSQQGTGIGTPMHPVQLGVTPVAVMRARPDLLIQNNAGNSQCPRRRGKRVVGHPGHPVGHSGLVPPFPAMHPVAVSRAEPSRARWNLWRVCLSAPGANHVGAIRDRPRRCAFPRAAASRSAGKRSERGPTLSTDRESHVQEYIRKEVI